jgi:hypothetical protein
MEATIFEEQEHDDKNESMDRNDGTTNIMTSNGNEDNGNYRILPKLEPRQLVLKFFFIQFFFI